MSPLLELDSYISKKFGKVLNYVRRVGSVPIRMSQELDCLNVLIDFAAKVDILTYEKTASYTENG